MISPSKFRVRFPEFADTYVYPDSRLDMFIEDSVLEMGADDSRWSGYYELAQSNLVAHKLTLSAAATNGQSSPKLGVITTKSADGVTVTRASVDLGLEYELYSGSSYGIEYVRIMKKLFHGGIVV